MIKKTCLRKIQERLPDGIVIRDETNFDFTDEEIISIFIWLKYFREHFRKFGFKELPPITIPVISRRLRLDFGLFNQPSNVSDEFGKYVVYLSPTPTIRKSAGMNEIFRVLGL